MTEGSIVPEDEIHGPRATVKEVLACQLSSWYPTFSNTKETVDADKASNQMRKSKLRKNVTIPSIIIDDLPMSDFKRYLLSDGVRLPKDATKLSSCAGVPNNTDDDDDGNEDDNEFYFPELNERIVRTISERFPSAGAVLPKLNWSAPRDATWINEGTMKCKTPGDVYLLLKSSDFCTYDVLYQSLQDCRDYRSMGGDSDSVNDAEDPSRCHPPLQLVLRKWCTLNPSMEFRCFVRRHELLGISQRQHSVHFPHLKQDKERICDIIHDFFEDYVQHRFAANAVESYVFDVFLDKKDRIWIVDFNPWARTTDPLLYEWSELTSMDETDGDESDGIRIAGSEGEVRHDPLASYRAPIDTVDLASMTQGDAKQFEEFMKLCQRPTYWEDDSEDD